MRPVITILCFLITVVSFPQKRPNLDSISSVLESVYEADQQPRLALDTLQKKHGFHAPEFQKELSALNKKDSINQVIVTTLIDKYGWLGPKEISGKANSTLFLVIQHADLKIQLKYLPILEKAVKQNKARAADYALLVDRTNLRQGRFQIYGSQLSSDAAGRLKFDPIVNEPEVNNRRKSVGLISMEEYAKHFGLSYNLPQKDKLKGKLILTIRLYGDGQPLDSATIHGGNSNTLGQTDKAGWCELAIDRPKSNYALIFKRDGYESMSYLIDDLSKDFIQITLSLRKK